MRPIVVFTGQGVARADGFNLTRRLKALGAFDGAVSAVPWKDRQNLDELFLAARDSGGPTLDGLLQATRTVCLKERRATVRKTAHRALFEALAEAATARLVLHLTANVDGLTSTFAVRDFGAVWPPVLAPTPLAEVARALAELLRRGRGLGHLPVHGEAALAASADDRHVLRTFYGNPAVLRGPERWIPTLASGLACDVRRIEERLPVARIGYGLLRALLAGEAVELDGLAALDPQPPADLLCIGYGAGSRTTRSLYPFERAIDAFVARGGARPPQRLVALLHDAPDSRPSALWYRERGFSVGEYRDGDLGVALEKALALTLPPPKAESAPAAAADAIRVREAQGPERLLPATKR